MNNIDNIKKLNQLMLNFMASYCGACPIERENCTSDHQMSCVDRILEYFQKELNKIK